MAKFQIFVDLGMSATKASFSDSINFYSYLCPPKVADLPPSELQILTDQGDQFGGGITSGAYLQVEDKAYALADDAEGRSNKSTEMLRKSTLAKLRILGAIGELAKRFSVDRLAIDIGVALPFDEYLSDQHEVSRQLSSASSFMYRGKSITIEPQAVKVLPEGAGLVQWRKMQAMQHGQTPQNSYVVVIVGHRDLTFLIFRQGKPPTGEPSGTVRLGYLEYLQSISQGMCKPDNPYLYDALIKDADTVAFPDQPGKQYPLTDRRRKAEAYYWEQVRHHLSDKFASLNIPNYEILIGGGTAHTLLQDNLNQLLSGMPGAEVNWLADMGREVCSVLRVMSPADQARFSDCYGGAKWLAIKFSDATNSPAPISKPQSMGIMS
ncbi:MAG: hypothetical protein WBA10_07235 [Elainellaceae cyanobacterium]